VPVAWRLTPAEARVATLVAQGLSNREVAERLSVSENTVVWHLRHVFATTGLTSRTQLAARVLRGSGMAGDG
jgi:DNA-binding CsgD family transcriptional regulator